MHNGSSPVVLIRAQYVYLKSLCIAGCLKCVYIINRLEIGQDTIAIYFSGSLLIHAEASKVSNMDLYGFVLLKETSGSVS